MLSNTAALLDPNAPTSKVPCPYRRFLLLLTLRARGALETFLTVFSARDMRSPIWRLVKPSAQPQDLALLVGRAR